MKVFCDNYDCMFIDEDGFCDCDKLNIVGGVCVGSYHGGRNATENDADERLQSENATLRELVVDMWRFTGTACKRYPRLFDPSSQGGQMVQLNMIDSFEQRMAELGIGVDV